MFLGALRFWGGWGRVCGLLLQVQETWCAHKIGESASAVIGDWSWPGREEKPSPAPGWGVGMATGGTRAGEMPLVLCLAGRSF